MQQSKNLKGSGIYTQQILIRLNLWFSACTPLAGEGTWLLHLHSGGRWGLGRPAAGAGTTQRCWSDLGEKITGYHFNNWTKQVISEIICSSFNGSYYQASPKYPTINLKETDGEMLSQYSDNYMYTASVNRKAHNQFTRLTVSDDHTKISKTYGVQQQDHKCKVRLTHRY